MITRCVTACRAGVTWCISPITGDDGRPSFSKLVVCAILALVARGIPVPTALAGLLVSAAFGIKAYLAYLEKATFSAADTAAVKLAHETTTHVEHTITEQIVARRDPDAGVEPAP